MNLTSNVIGRKIVVWTTSALALAVFAGALGGALDARAADSVGEKIGAAATDAGKKIQEASQTAQSKMAELWRRIDEKRLVNRTPDQLMAWVIMGLLAGGLINQFSKLHKLTNLLFGLIGALIGGIVANVIQVDLGMGPVLIRYEELLASLAGGVLLVIAGRYLAARRALQKRK